MQPLVALRITFATLLGELTSLSDETVRSMDQEWVRNVCLLTGTAFNNVSRFESRRIAFPSLLPHRVA